MAATSLATSPTVNEILKQTSLRWIFVGGKGGVGKTTTSSALATLLAAHRKSVLIISTDPAHNLSDAFGQKFGDAPTPVEGFTNLHAMEIDPVRDWSDLGETEIFQGFSASLISEVVGSIPGIDEAVSFAEMIRLVNSMNFDCIIFDTAPTGHTLRLLALPDTMKKGMAKIAEMKSKFGGMFRQFKDFFPGQPEQMEANFFEKLNGLSGVVSDIAAQFKNPDLTTFICVCIPEFLSIYETERLLQELAKLKMDSRCIVVNQVLIPPADSTCQLCNTRRKMQKKHLEQIDELYEDFNVVKVPLLESEVRGVPALKGISQYLVTPINLP